MIDSELVALISQQHEAWLNELEGLAIEAIATNDWTGFYTHVVDFQNEHELHGEDEPSDSPSEASTKSLTRSGADLFSRTN